MLIGGFFLVTKHTAAQTSVITATIQISVCGNSIKEGGEQCDNPDLNGKTCAHYGFTGGTLNCNPACEFVTTNCTSTTPPSGGGGFISYAPIETNVRFEGRAYPLSKVTILKDGQIAITTIAGPDAKFDVTLTGLSSGNYMFAVYGEDRNAVRSSLFTFPVYITQGASTRISGIFIAPTIGVDKEEVAHGENITIFGQTVPDGNVTISVNSHQEIFKNTSAGKDGIYLLLFDTSVLEDGQHQAKAKAASQADISSFGKTVGFSVGAVPAAAAKGSKGDINNDGKVSLVDFSVAAYWYKRPSPPGSVDISGDGVVNLVDFSIMAYYWTG